MRTYKDNTSIYTPSQRWRPNVAQDRIPASSCKLQHAEYVTFQESWEKMNAAGVNLDQYLNYHCLETNAIEGVLQFDPPVRPHAPLLPLNADRVYRLPSCSLGRVSIARCRTDISLPVVSSVTMRKRSLSSKIPGRYGSAS